MNKANEKPEVIKDGDLTLVYTESKKPCYLHDEIEGRRVMGGANGKVWMDAGRWEYYPRIFGLEWTKL